LTAETSIVVSSIGVVDVHAHGRGAQLGDTFAVHQVSKRAMNENKSHDAIFFI